VAITYETRWITPNSAAAYLREQVTNRTLSVPRVQKYARDMASGDWYDTGDTIKLNREGKMLDGQHRLAAVVLAEKLVQEDRERGQINADDPEYQGYADFTGIYLEFALGVLDEARQAMDLNRNRKPADEMTMEGQANAARIAPIATWLLAYGRGNYTNASGSASSTWRPTEAEVLAYWRKHKDRLYTSMYRGYDASRQKLGPTAALGVAYDVLRTQFGDEVTEAFWEPLVTGANLVEKDPILVLRNQLIRKKYTRAERLGLVFKAWNLWIDGDEVSNIYFREKLTNATFHLPRDPKAKKTGPLPGRH